MVHGDKVGGGRMEGCPGGENRVSEVGSLNGAGLSEGK